MNSIRCLLINVGSNTGEKNGVAPINVDGSFEYWPIQENKPGSHTPRFRDLGISCPYPDLFAHYDPRFEPVATYGDVRDVPAFRSMAESLKNGQTVLLLFAASLRYLGSGDEKPSWIVQQIGYYVIGFFVVKTLAFPQDSARIDWEDHRLNAHYLRPGHDKQNIKVLVRGSSQSRLLRRPFPISIRRTNQLFPNQWLKHTFRELRGGMIVGGPWFRRSLRNARSMTADKILKAICQHEQSNQSIPPRVTVRCGTGVRSCNGSHETAYRLPRGTALKSLRQDFENPNSEIRFYYIDSVQWSGNHDGNDGLYQFGSGLNLKGKYATLCTCKRKMINAIYTALLEKKNKSVYVAVLGDTQGRRPGSNTSPIIFLGKVEKSFDSFLEIWKYLPKKDRMAKDVRREPLGDIYPPNLVRKFNKFGSLAASEFSKDYVHANKAYKADLTESRPLVFKQWRAWPDGDALVDVRSIGELPGDIRSKFIRMIRKPRPAAYGWVYRLSDLKPILRKLAR